MPLQRISAWRIINARLTDVIKREGRIINRIVLFSAVEEVWPALKKASAACQMPLLHNNISNNSSSNKERKAAIKSYVGLWKNLFDPLAPSHGTVSIWKTFIDLQVRQSYFKRTLCIRKKGCCSERLLIESPPKNPFLL